MTIQQKALCGSVPEKLYPSRCSIQAQMPSAHDINVVAAVLLEVT